VHAHIFLSGCSTAKYDSSAKFGQTTQIEVAEAYCFCTKLYLAMMNKSESRQLKEEQNSAVAQAL